MQGLTEMMASLIRHGAKQAGSYEPEEVLSYVEEELTSVQYAAATEFLTWCSKGKHTFGHNIEAVWERWQGEIAPVADKRKRAAPGFKTNGIPAVVFHRAYEEIQAANQHLQRLKNFMRRPTLAEAKKLKLISDDDDIA